jgi:REP element-mobilizing transposase RayT
VVHAYHVIWGAYGFWLPNDPCGSWSDFVASWELARFGKASMSESRDSAALTRLVKWRERAQESLKYLQVILTGQQAQSVGKGFAEAVRKSRFSILACSILPQHVHLVIARHTYEVEQIANLLKGEATKQLKADSLHPHARAAKSNGKVPSMWAVRLWKVYLDNQDAIEAAICYVEENPIKEGKPLQKWSFVRARHDVDKTGWVTYP